MPSTEAQRVGVVQINGHMLSPDVTHPDKWTINSLMTPPASESLNIRIHISFKILYHINYFY